MPLNGSSSRTTWVKAAAWGLAESERAAKSAMATRGLLTFIPIAVRNQSCAAAERPQKPKNTRTKKEPRHLSFACTLTSETQQNAEIRTRALSESTAD